MALRSLSTEILFRDKATQALQGVDTEIDGIRDGIEGTQGDFSDLSHETGEFAYSARSDMQDVGSGVDDLGHKTGGFRDMMGKTGDFVQRNWNMIAGAIGGAGIAMEAFARQQQDMIITSEQLAHGAEVQAGEVRNMALELHDATFDLEDIYEVLTIARQRGLEPGSEAMKEFAETWDTVADASGEGVGQLAKGGIALQAIGVEVGEEKEAFDALGFILRDTTASVTDFMNFIGKAAPDLRDMNMDVDEAAAVFGALEGELSLTAREARTEFRKALREAEGDMGVMLDTLGLTEGQFVDYKGQVGEASGVIEDWAQMLYDAQTPAQHLQAEIQGLTHQYGAHFMPIIEMLSPVMMGLATVMGIVTMATYLKTAGLFAATGAALTFGVTIAGVTAPLWLLVAAIAAVGAGIYLLWNNWDEVISWIQGTDLYQTGKDIIMGLAEGILGAVDWVKDAVTGVRDTIVGGITDFFGISSPAQLMIEYGGYIGEGLHLGMEEESENFFRRARQMFRPDRETAVATGGVNFNANVTVNASGGDAEEIANKVDKRLRQTFGRHADRYFGSQRRKR